MSRAFILFLIFLTSSPINAAGPATLLDELPTKMPHAAMANNTNAKVHLQNWLKDRKASGLMIAQGVIVANYLGIVLAQTWQFGWRGATGVGCPNSSGWLLPALYNVVRILPAALGVVAGGYAQWQKLKIDMVKKGTLSAAAAQPSTQERFLMAGVPLVTALSTGWYLLRNDISCGTFADSFTWMLDLNEDGFLSQFLDKNRSLLNRAEALGNLLPFLSVPLNLGTAWLIYSRHRELKNLDKSSR